MDAVSSSWIKANNLPGPEGWGKYYRHSSTTVDESTLLNHILYF